LQQCENRVSLALHHPGCIDFLLMILVPVIAVVSGKTGIFHIP
jgi:hypothetical protein